MSRGYLRIVACLAVLMSVSAVAGAAGTRELESRTQDLETRFDALEGRSTQSLVEMQQQIETSRQELRSLRGEIDEARNDLESLRKQQRELYADLDRRLMLMEQGQPAGSGTQAADGAAGAGTPASAVSSEVVFADEAAVYGDAFAALKSGRYDDAVRGFDLYLTKYPRGPRADNATYWMGESLYVQQDFAGALKYFQAVSSFRDSRKLPDALLKAGYCQYELQADKEARASLKKVITNFPDAEAARLAQARLTLMDTQGR